MCTTLAVMQEGLVFGPTPQETKVTLTTAKRSPQPIFKSLIHAQKLNLNTTQEGWGGPSWNPGKLSNPAFPVHCCQARAAAQSSCAFALRLCPSLQYLSTNPVDQVTTQVAHWMVSRDYNLSPVGQTSCPSVGIQLVNTPQSRIALSRRARALSRIVLYSTIL